MVKRHVHKKLAICRNYLTNCQKEINEIRRNPKVIGWNKINFNKYSPVFESFGIPPGLLQARDQYEKQAEDMSFQLVRLSNIVGTLEADFSIKSTDESKAVVLVQKTEKNCATLEQPMAVLISYRDTLLAGDKTLRENLTIDHLIPIARSRTKKKNK